MLLALGLSYLLVSSEKPSVLLKGNNEVFFAAGKSVFAFSLDTGDVTEASLDGEVLPYQASPLNGGAVLLSFVDDALVPGFVVIDRSFHPKIAVYEMTPWLFGDDFLLGVYAAEPVEMRATRNSVSLYSLKDFRTLFTLRDTVPLPPISFFADEQETLAGETRAKPQSIHRPLLLLSFIPSKSGDLIYPFEPSGVTFRLLSEKNGNFLWRVRVDLSKPVSSLECFYQDSSYILLGGAIDYDWHLFLALDARSGKLLWQKVSDYFPYTFPIYPYAGYASVLPVLPGKGNSQIVFPAFRVQGETIEFVEVSLDSGDFRAVPAKPTLSELREKFYSSYLTAPKPPSSQTYELADGSKLTILEGEKIFLESKANHWELPFFPEFGSGLRLEASGDKYLLLLEEPYERSHLAFQGIPHILSATTGKKFEFAEMAKAKYLVPYSTNDSVLFLTKRGLYVFRKDRHLAHSRLKFRKP